MITTATAIQQCLCSFVDTSHFRGADRGAKGGGMRLGPYTSIFGSIRRSEFLTNTQSMFAFVVTD